jgi:hypothetical protein
MGSASGPAWGLFTSATQLHLPPLFKFKLPWKDEGSQWGELCIFPRGKPYFPGVDEWRNRGNCQVCTFAPRLRPLVTLPIAGCKRMLGRDCRPRLVKVAP